MGQILCGQLIMKTYEIVYIDQNGDCEDKTIGAEDIEEALEKFKKVYRYAEITAIGEF